VITNPPLSRKVSRRRFLGNAAALSAAGAGVLGAACAWADPSAKKASRATQTDYDVIVVGGGFSGVTAARDCQKNGLRTLLLEAKSRLGGRTFDTQFRGHHIELGGTWVHWTQSAVWSEITRYGFEIEQTAGAVPEQMILVDGAKHIAFATADRMSEVVSGIDSYFADSGRVWERPYDAAFGWKEVMSRSAMTAVDRLKEVSLTPLQRGFLIPLVEAMGHCPFDQASYVEMLHMYALGLNTWTTAVDSLSRYKLPAGTGALARRIAADGKAEIRLNSPVRRIEQRNDVVIVTPQTGEAVTARAVVLALPARVLANVEFVPGLSSLKLTAARTGFTPSGIKLYTEVKGRLGKVEWVSSGSKKPGMFWTYGEFDKSTLLVGFAPRHTDYDGNDEASVQEVLRQFDPSVEVLGCTSYAWGSDPFALGTYSSFVPGGFTRYFRELMRAEGRIYMAGGDIGESGWRNCIDGAIGRGALIARQVSETLLS
jgi:pseudooxynicotine oxidase